MKKEVEICDLCDNENKVSLSVHRCVFCLKHICIDHSLDIMQMTSQELFTINEGIDLCFNDSKMILCDDCSIPNLMQYQLIPLCSSHRNNIFSILFCDILIIPFVKFHFSFQTPSFVLIFGLFLFHHS